jgi:type II secretion system protein N
VTSDKKWLGYVLYGLVLTIILLYTRFPSDAVQDYFRARALGADPPLALSVDNIGPSIPIGLKFTNARVTLQNSPNRVILEADKLLIKRRLWSLLWGKSQYSFYCMAYEGDMRGKISFDKVPDGGLMDTEMTLEGLHVEDYPYLSHLIGRPVEGTLGGTISYSGPNNSMLAGSGEAQLNLSDGRMELLEPFLTLKSIDFSEMKIDMALKEQKIDITRLALKGQQLQGSLSGTVTLARDVENSTLNLKGKIQPFAALFKNAEAVQNTVALFKERLTEGTLSFEIYGTLKEPSIKFN